MQDNQEYISPSSNADVPYWKTTPDACHHCRETFGPGRLRFVIFDGVDHSGGWGKVSICVDCFKWMRPPNIGEEDYRWACAVLADRDLAARCPVHFAPVYGELDAAQLAEWVLRDHLPVRLQLPVHKILWGGDTRGV